MAWTNHAGKTPVLPRMIEMVVGIARPGFMTDPAVALDVDVGRGRVTRLVLKDAVLGSGRRGMRRSNRSRPTHGNVTAPHFSLAAGGPGRFSPWAAMLSNGANANQ